MSELSSEFAPILEETYVDVFGSVPVGGVPEHSVATIEEVEVLRQRGESVAFYAGSLVVSSTKY